MAIEGVRPDSDIESDAPPGADDTTSHDILEIVATVILGLAIMLIAWNSLQSALWSGEQDKANTQAVLINNQSNDAYQLADGIKTLDQLLFVQFLVSGCASDDGADELRAFTCDQIIRNLSQPGLDAIDEWSNNDSEEPPFETDAYFAALYSDAEGIAAESLAFVETADEANTKADQYESTSAALAMVLFFAGISLVISWRRLRIVMLAMAGVIMVASAVYVATLDTVWPPA
jgi:hypothetical protein